MKKSFYLLFVLIILSALALTACGGGDDNAENNQGSTGTAQTLDRPEPAADYAGKTNPHNGDSASAEAGKTVYTTNCASCHGDTAKGDGPAAASLNPKPQDLADNQKGLSDAYMFWRISEGGAMAPFNSAMPAWKGVLSEDQIWQVITYLRTLGG